MDSSVGTTGSNKWLSGVTPSDLYEAFEEIFEASGDLPYEAKPFNPYEDEEPPVHYKLENHLMSNYNPKLIPKRRTNQTVRFVAGILELSE